VAECTRVRCVRAVGVFGVVACVGLGGRAALARRLRWDIQLQSVETGGEGRGAWAKRVNASVAERVGSSLRLLCGVTCCGYRKRFWHARSLVWCMSITPATPQIVRMTGTFIQKERIAVASNQNCKRRF